MYVEILLSYIADGSATTELRRSLEEYLSLLIGLTMKGLDYYCY